jgi:hypothetical protein
MPPTDELAAEAAKLEVQNQVEGDEAFGTAVEEDADEGVESGAFSVSKEELAMIRAELASDFPEDYMYLSDAYILSVASKPYSKDPTVRRPLEYSQEKMYVTKNRLESNATDFLLSWPVLCCWIRNISARIL